MANNAIYPKAMFAEPESEELNSVKNKAEEAIINKRKKKTIVSNKPSLLSFDESYGSFEPSKQSVSRVASPSPATNPRNAQLLGDSWLRKEGGAPANLVSSRAVRKLPPAKALKRAMLVVYICCKFMNILEDIKLFGTSSTLYDMGFRTRKAVLKNLFPNVKKEGGSTQRVRKRCLIYHKKSTFLGIWNIVMLCCMVYVVLVMPYSMAFWDGVVAVARLEDALDIIFIADMVLNFFVTYQSAEGL